MRINAAHGRHLLLTFAAVTAVMAYAIPSVISAQAAQTPEALVEKVLTALGGREALGKLTSRRSTGTVTLSTQAGDLSGPIEILLKAPNKSRWLITLDLSAVGAAGSMTIEQKFDGTAAWAINSMQGDTEITGNQLENMRNALFPTPLLTVKENGTKMELQSNQTVAGKNTLVLLVTPKAGSAVRMFIDPDTSLPVRTIATVDVPQAGGPIEQISDLSDYRLVDNVKVPFHIVNANPLQTVTFSFTKIEHNVPIDDAVFVKK
jgi:hypothetical protein